MCQTSHGPGVFVWLKLQVPGGQGQEFGTFLQKMISSSLKFARFKKVEHLNRYLQDCFRSLGVNLNEENAQRINKSTDLGNGEQS